MLYRDHRGSLADSLTTQQEFTTQEGLIAYLQIDLLTNWGQELLHVESVYTGYDTRIDWPTYLVRVRTTGQDGFWVAGMANEEITPITVKHD